jgi:hypothetical protein
MKNGIADRAMWRGKMIVPGSELIASALAPLTSFTPQLAYVLLQGRRLPEPGMNRRIIKSWLSFTNFPLSHMDGYIGAKCRID